MISSTKTQNKLSEIYSEFGVRPSEKDLRSIPYLDYLFENLGEAQLLSRDELILGPLPIMFMLIGFPPNNQPRIYGPFFGKEGADKALYLADGFQEHYFIGLPPDFLTREYTLGE